jgi:hypothetical protein
MEMDLWHLYEVLMLSLRSQLYGCCSGACGIGHSKNIVIIFHKQADPVPIMPYGQWRLPAKKMMFGSWVAP